jgi:hypothetical protein
MDELPLEWPATEPRAEPTVARYPLPGQADTEPEPATIQDDRQLQASAGEDTVTVTGPCAGDPDRSDGQDLRAETAPAAEASLEEDEDRPAQATGSGDHAGEPPQEQPGSAHDHDDVDAPSFEPPALHDQVEDETGDTPPAATDPNDSGTTNAGPEKDGQEPAPHSDAQTREDLDSEADHGDDDAPARGAPGRVEEGKAEVGEAVEAGTDQITGPDTNRTTAPDAADPTNGRETQTAPAAAPSGTPAPPAPPVDAPLPQPAAAATGTPLARRPFAARRLESHLRRTFASRPDAARRLASLLDLAAPLDPTGQVAYYRSALDAYLDPTAGIATGPVLHQALRHANLVGHFRDLDPEPFAVGAIAQAHRALTPAGQPVVVKLMRPDIWNRLPEDLTHVAEAAKAISKHAGTDITPALAGIRAQLRAEFAFHEEAQRQYAFGQVANGIPGRRVTVPAVLLVSQLAIVSEELPGTPYPVAAATLGPADRAAAAQALVNFALTAAVNTGMVHALPTPQNVLLTDDGRISLLDFGACVSVPVAAPDAVSSLLLATQRDVEPGIVRAMQDLGILDRGATGKTSAAVKAGRALAQALTDPAHTPGPGHLRSWAATVRRVGTVPDALAHTLRALQAHLGVAAALGATVDLTEALRALPGSERLFPPA